MAIQLDTEAGPSAPGPSQYGLAQTLTAHTRSVTALRFSPDGQTLVSSGADGWVHFWDAESGEHARALRCHSTGINDLSLSPDGLYFATASDDATALVFAMDPLATRRPSHDADGRGPTPPGSTPPPPANPGARPTPLRTLAGHTAPALAVAFSPKANLVVTGSYDESAIIWDIRRGKALRTIPAHAEAIWTVGWDTDGALVITGSADGLIRLWDASTGQCLKTFDNESNSPVSYAAFTPSSFFLLSSTLSSTIRIYSLNTGRVLKTLRAAEYVNERFPSPALVFAAPHAALAGLANGQANQPAGWGADPNAMDIDTSGDAGLCASVTRIPTRAPIHPAWVVAGSETGALVVWDLQHRRVRQVLDGHTMPILALAVHPSGRAIATGALEPDASIKLWRTA